MLEPIEFDLQLIINICILLAVGVVGCKLWRGCD